MLEPIRHLLSQQRIVLASGSPRRLEILKMIGLKFEVQVSKFEENLDKHTFSHPCEYVKENAKQKAIEVWNRLSASKSSTDDGGGPDLVIGADTVVTLYDEIMEKPKDEEDAFDMLKKLSGLKHTVFTGVALVTKTKLSPQLQKQTTSSQPSSFESHDLEQTATGAQSLQNPPTFDFQQHLNKQTSGNTKDYLVTTFHESTDVTMAELNNDIIKGYIATGEPFDKAGAYAIQSNGATLVEQIKGDYYNVVGMPLHRLCRELYILHCDL